VRVSSSDRVSVAVHGFGGSGRTFLWSHATGFHGYCYLPVADRLDDRFTSYGVDYRGHGDTPAPLDDGQGPIDWVGYGDDAEAVATTLAPGGGLLGFGHSMGGAALLMAAHRHPGLFDLIVAFEPIVFPPPDPADPPPPSPLVEGARRRRSTFDSFESAIENYASKPPMQGFDPDVLRLYVAHGFRPSPEGVRLKCDPEHEARTFEGSTFHPTWELLPEIHTRVVVIGSGDEQGPARAAAPVAEALPNAALIHLPDVDHFWPFVDPAGTAALVTELVAEAIPDDAGH
jgi:pimeloyl-ACP methyl ester carboxylesterase